MPNADRPEATVTVEVTCQMLASCHGPGCECVLAEVQILSHVFHPALEDPWEVAGLLQAALGVKLREALDVAPESGE